MSRRVKLLMCVLCAGAAIVWLAVTAVQAQDQPAVGETDADELAELRAEVQQLQDQVEQLEERLSKLEGGIHPLEFRFTPDGRTVPPTSPAPWIRERTPQGEINGVPYYIIPLGEE